MGNIESIQVAYDRTKSYIVYDSFQYIMIAIVVFLIGMKLWDEWQKNLLHIAPHHLFGIFVLITSCKTNTHVNAMRTTSHLLLRNA